MTHRLLLALMVLSGTMTVQAHDDDILFTVDGQPVHREEFVRSYEQTRAASGETYKKASDYLEAYADYKVKVHAALVARLDTTASFRSRLAAVGWAVQPEENFSVTEDCNDQQQRRIAETAALSPDADMVRLSQIFLKVPLRGNRHVLQQVIRQADSLYRALNQGADFQEMARRYSQDASTASHGGLIGWVGPNQMMKEIEQAAFALGNGTVSRPVQTPAGYHILQVTDRCQARLLSQHIPEQTEPTPTGENTIRQDIYEGLLLSELAEHSTLARATFDEDTKARYFKKNKKRYRTKGFKPKKYTEVEDLVVADLKSEMEKHWMADLRQRYPVVMDKKVIKTIQ